MFLEKKKREASSVSEQTGASLVLAQTLIPQQTFNGKAVAADQAEGPFESSLEGEQGIVIPEENTSAFADLLTREGPDQALPEPPAEGTGAQASSWPVPALVAAALATSTAAVAEREPADGTALPPTGNEAASDGQLPPLIRIPEANLTPPGSPSATGSADFTPTTPATVTPAPQTLGGATNAMTSEVADRSGAKRLLEPLSRAQALPQTAAEGRSAVTETPSSASEPETPPPLEPRPLPATRQTTDGPAITTERGSTSVSSFEQPQSLEAELGRQGQDQQQSGSREGQRSAPSISFSTQAPGIAVAATPLTAAGTPASTSATLLSQPVVLLGDPSTWAEPLQQRIAALARGGFNSAELRLHPPSLGQLEVRISMQQDQATLWLASPSAEVRDVLQQSLSRLEGLFEELGIQLAGAQVGDGRAEADSSSADAELPGGEDQPGNPGEAPGSSRTTKLGLLDAWA